jgi:colicin import membrane protein
MGMLGNKIGDYVGLLSAALFIIAAFVMVLVSDDTIGGDILSVTARYVLIAAGVLAIVSGIFLILKGGNFISKIVDIMIIILGVVAILCYVLIGNGSMGAQLMVEILGAVAIIGMIAAIGSDWTKGLLGVMYIDFLFLVMTIVLVAILALGLSVTIVPAAIILIIGFWLASAVFLGQMEAAPKKGEIDPNRKSAKRAQKEQEKKEAEAKKEQKREETREKAAKEKAKEEKKPEEKPAEQKSESVAIAVPAEEKKEEPAAEPVEEAPAEEPADEAPAEEPVEEPVEEAPAEEKPNNDFMSKLVSSKDAAGAAAAGAAVAAAADDDDEEDEDDEVLEDIYTDYSPEALVRRAAWNRGLRCRRDYGDLHVPVAFVKGKVAVYVEEPGNEDKEAEAKLKEDGWVVLRFDINKVTDGLDEGAQIAEAVKANKRAMKAAKKKKSSKK